MSNVKLDWKGDAWKHKVEQAILDAIDECTHSAVTPAKQKTPVRTGTLQGSIMAEAAKRIGGVTMGRFGSFDVNYAIFIEAGAQGRAGRYMLRQAADQEFPKLKARIQARLN